MRQKFEMLVQKYVKRKGVKAYLNAVAESGFYEAWASTTFHCNYDGGLVEHTINVIEYALKLREAYGSNVSEESIVLCSALHDWGKAFDYYVPNLLKSGNPSGTKPMKINPDLTIKNHALRSLMTATRFFDLTEDERVAILSHDGWYVKENYEYMMNPSELLTIIHNADFYVARFVEPVKSYKKGD